MTYRTFDGTSQVEAITNGRFSSDGTQYLKDSETINVGTSSDLKILHDGSNSIISDEGTGQLKLQTNGENIQLNKGTTENMIVARTDGSVDLYHDNTKKFETTAAGANISGRALIGTTTLAPYATRILTVGDTTTDDTALEIRSSDDTTGRLYFTDSASAGEGAYQGELTFNHSDNSFYLKINSETSLKSVKDGAVELNYNGAKKFETTSVGVKVTGNYQAVDGYHIYLGTGNDLDIVHDATDSWIKNSTGYLYLDSGTSACRIISDSSWADGSMAAFYRNGAVELYYDNAKKIETTAWGVQITGDARPAADDSTDLGTTGARWDDVYATNGTIQTSDRNQKNTIVTSDLGLPFINKLKPVSYKFNNKTRTHYGLISQDVETVLSDISKATSEFAGFIKEDDSYGLRYNEFIAPLIKAVQELSAKVTALENA